MGGQPTAAWLQLLADAILSSQPATRSIAATSTSASPDLTGLGDAAGLQIGAIVVTPSAAVGKTVVAIDNAANTATLSGNAGVTATGAWVFAPPADALPMMVGLFTGSPTLTPATVIGDLAEPTYAGYARQAVTQGSVRGDAAGDIIIPLGTSTWQPTGTVDPEQTITGVFIMDTATGLLLQAELLATPWTATGPLDALDVVSELYIPAISNYGLVCTTCTP